MTFLLTFIPDLIKSGFGKLADRLAMAKNRAIVRDVETYKKLTTIFAVGWNNTIYSFS